VSELFSKEETILFQMLRRSILPQNDAEQLNIDFSEEEWGKLVRITEKHGVFSLLYSLLYEQLHSMSRWSEKIEKASTKTVLQQYRLLFLSKYLIEVLEGEEIPVVLLKGVTIGGYYPVPELRNSGDVDLLLLNMEQEEKAKKLLEKCGYQLKEEQFVVHHVCYTTPEGIDIELHTMMAEPFDNDKTNACLKKAFVEASKQKDVMDVMGVTLPVLRGAFYPYELLLHMLQHFLRSGFGLKLLCDWVMFWQKGLTEEEQELYLNLVEETGIKGFSDVVTLTCIQFLGLAESLVSWMNLKQDYPVEEFLREILDAEEFGNSNKNRMVVMRGTGLFDYIREFHHQMHLNFPRAGRNILLWPVLWPVTLFRFLRNNRKLRKVSTKSVLKEAKRRSRLMEELKLFQ